MLIWGSWRLLLSLCGGWVGFAESFSFPTQLLFWGRVVVGLLLGLSQFFHCNPRHSLSLFFLFIKGQKHKIWLETIKIALGRWCVFALHWFWLLCGTKPFYGMTDGYIVGVIGYAIPDTLSHCNFTLTLTLAYCDDWNQSTINVELLFNAKMDDVGAMWVVMGRVSDK